MAEKSEQQINGFSGRWSFLSNFYPAPMLMEDGKYYPTVEHYYQSQKAVFELDREMIRCASSPRAAKMMGRDVATSADWLQRRQEVMLRGLRAKFGKHLDLAEKLLATGTAEIREVNHWHDNYWGICWCNRCARLPSRNELGKLLMQVRCELRAERPDRVYY